MKTMQMMSFEEFRQSSEMSEVVRRQREHLRDDRAAEELLRPGALGMRGWPEWPSNEQV